MKQGFFMYIVLLFITLITSFSLSATDFSAKKMDNEVLKLAELFGLYQTHTAISESSLTKTFAPINKLRTNIEDNVDLLQKEYNPALIRSLYTLLSEIMVFENVAKNLSSNDAPEIHEIVSIYFPASKLAEKPILQGTYDSLKNNAQTIVNIYKSTINDVEKNQILSDEEKYKLALSIGFNLLSLNSFESNSTGNKNFQLFADNINRLQKSLSSYFSSLIVQKRSNDYSPASINTMLKIALFNEDLVSLVHLFSL